MTRLTRLLLAALVATSSACLSPVDPADAEAEAVRVLFGAGSSADTIQVRRTTRAVAIAIAREGHDIGATDFTYRSSDTSVAVVDANGTVRGISPGTATITAERRGLEGSGEIVVVPSAVAYTIAAGTQPGALAFSTDYTRAYVLVGGDSLAILHALDHYRIRTIPVGLPSGDVASTATAVYVTHPLHDSVTVLSAGTGERTGRLWIGAGPSAIVASAARAYVAMRYDEKVVILGGASPIGVPLGGEPGALALARDSERLFVTVQRGAGWRLVSVEPSYPDTLASVALPAEPLAVATDADGTRAWVLVSGAVPRVLAFDVDANGRFTATGELAVGAGATGIAVRPDGAFVIASGEPLSIADGAALVVRERIAGVGTGRVVVRPDGLFAFVVDPATGLVKVVVL
jgi:DNA-binding beta-propeller fold protein YncE